MFGQSIMNDIVQEVVNESSHKGEADLEYTMKVESIPEFDPVDPEKLKFTKLVHEPDQKDIDERF